MRQTSPWKYWTAAALLGAAALYLSLLFPNTGDDWLRDGLGATIHSPLDLLRAVAGRYLTTNGRAMGNLLAYAAGSRPMLRAILRAGLWLGLLLLGARAGGLGRCWGLILMAAGLTALPREMFRQIYPWAAGFFNYVPPVAVSFGCLTLVDSPRAARSRGLRVLTALLGFLGQLFVEHMTIYALLAALFAVWLTRGRPNGKTARAYLLGAALGAAVLFVSPSYRHMAGAGGAYQAAAGLAGLEAMARKNYPEIMRYLVLDCPVPVLAVTVGGGLCFRRSRRRAGDWLLLAALVGTALVLLGGGFLPNHPVLVRRTGLLWLGTALAGSLRWPERTSGRRGAFWIASALVVALPLLAVDPIGPRCLFGSYAFLLAGAGRLLVAAGAEDWRPAPMGLIAAGLGAAVLIFYGRIYYPIHQTEQLRTALIRQALAQGESSVEIPRFPREEYLWDADSQKIESAYYDRQPGDLSIHTAGGPS